MTKSLSDHGRRAQFLAYSPGVLVWKLPQTSPACEPCYEEYLTFCICWVSDRNQAFSVNQTLGIHCKAGCDPSWWIWRSGGWGLASKGCQTLRNVFMALGQAVLFGNVETKQEWEYICTSIIYTFFEINHVSSSHSFSLSLSLSLLSVFDVFGSSTFPVEMEVAGQDLHSQLCS